MHFELRVCLCYEGNERKMIEKQLTKFFFQSLNFQQIISDRQHHLEHINMKLFFTITSKSAYLPCEIQPNNNNKLHFRHERIKRDSRMGISPKSSCFMRLRSIWPVQCRRRVMQKNRRILLNFSLVSSSAFCGHAVESQIHTSRVFACSSCQRLFAQQLMVCKFANHSRRSS
jgi:hypothetical protein